MAKYNEQLAALLAAYHRQEAALREGEGGRDG